LSADGGKRSHEHVLPFALLQCAHGEDNPAVGPAQSATNLRVWRCRHETMDINAWRQHGDCLARHVPGFDKNLFRMPAVGDHLRRRAKDDARQTRELPAAGCERDAPKSLNGGGQKAFRQALAAVNDVGPILQDDRAKAQ
jgi:hypothetical protein